MCIFPLDNCIDIWLLKLTMILKILPVWKVREAAQTDPHDLSQRFCRWRPMCRRASPSCVRDQGARSSAAWGASLRQCWRRRLTRPPAAPRRSPSHRVQVWQREGGREVCWVMVRKPCLLAFLMVLPCFENGMAAGPLVCVWIFLVCYFCVEK